MDHLKKFSIISAAIVVAGGLTACGGAQQATKSVTNNSTNSSADKGTSDSVPNLNGRTITVAAWWDNTPDGKTALSKEMIDQQKKVEKKYNVKIKYVNVFWNDYNKKLTTSVLAGQPYADVIRMTASWALPDIAKNLIMPLNSYAPDMTKFKNTEGSMDFNGVKYGFDSTNGVSADGIFYNMDLFNKYGLPDPQQLVKDNKWTWDEFEKLAKQATIDTTNSGKPDVWGLSGWDQDALNFFLASDGARMVDNNGKVNLTDPKVIESLEFFQQLYRDHVFKEKPKSNIDNFQEWQTFADGDVAMTAYYEWAHDTFKKVNYGFVPFPRGPHGTGYVSFTTNPSFWVIPKGVKDPNVVMEIFNELSDVKPVDAYPGETQFENEFKHQADIDNAKMLSQHNVILPKGSYDGFPTGQILSDILLKNKDVTTVLKQYQPVAQSAVDKILHPAQ